MPIVLFATIEVCDDGDWETVCTWCLGHQDVNDLYDAISGVEEWPADASVLVSEPEGKRFTFCDVDELLGVWPLPDQPVPICAFLRAAKELDRTYETRILFHTEREDGVSNETAPKSEVLQ